MSGVLGRFLSPDAPLADQDGSDPQSWNLYSYVRNHPMALVDPTGQWAGDPEESNPVFSVTKMRILTESDQQSQLKAIRLLTGNRSVFSNESDQRFHGKPISDRGRMRRVIGKQ